MSETLWITIPINDENALKNVISLIASKNLPSLSIDQLVKKLEKHQAADWIEVLTEYNKIPSLHENIPPSEILDRSRSVRTKFGEEGTEGTESTPAMKLKDRLFEPRELLSLVILCYSNPNLIGPKLCKALNDQNEADIKKEMLENSARVGNRVAPWASNLRLLSTALYFNDTTIRLPVDVIDKVTRQTIRDGRIVYKIDEQNGFSETVNGPERAASEANEREEARVKRDQSEVDSYAVLQSLQSAQSVSVREDQGHTPFQLDRPVSAVSLGYSGNGSELTTEVLPEYATNNAANSNSGGGNVLLMGSLALFQIARSSPVGAVIRNIGKDVLAAGGYVGNFFSRNSTSEQPREEKTTLLSPTVRS